MSNTKDDLRKELKKKEESLYKQMQAEQKAELDAMAEKIGHKVTHKDMGYWGISEKYKKRYHDEIVEPRKKAFRALEKSAEPTDVIALASRGERICVTPNCGNIIAPTGKRGRPAIKCEDCRGKK